MNPATCLILCGGDGSRWGNHLGVPKHLIPIAGESLLSRTARLIQDADPYADVIVVAPDDDRYRIDGAQLVQPMGDEFHGNANKFLDSAPLWNRDGRTICFLGDVWFSCDAIYTILAFSSPRWQAFGRPRGSLITGSQWGEIFAISFTHEHRERFLEALLELAHRYRQGLVAASGWASLRLMAGMPPDRDMPDEYLGTGLFTEIDDFTDDFDEPRDHEAWLTRFHERGGVP
jgi:hypothetical protein